MNLHLAFSSLIENYMELGSEGQVTLTDSAETWLTLIVS